MLKQNETFDLISELYYTTLLKGIEKQKIIEKQNTSDLRLRASSAKLASDGQAGGPRLWLDTSDSSLQNSTTKIIIKNMSLSVTTIQTLVLGGICSDHRLLLHFVTF